MFVFFFFFFSSRRRHTRCSRDWSSEVCSSDLWRFRKKPSSRSSKLTSLVIQTAFLGDVVLTTPLLEALARRHGPVDVVTTSAAAPLLETHQAVRRVFPYDKRGKDLGLRRLFGLAQI